MIRAVLACAVLALSSCATPLPHVVDEPGDVFSVRYDPNVQTLDQVNALANAHCANGAAGYVSQETRFDGFTYRTSRCAFR
jgi:hypothetical protein